MLLIHSRLGGHAARKNPCGLCAGLTPDQDLVINAASQLARSHVAGVRS